MIQIIFFLFEGFPSGCSLITRSFQVSSQVAESFLKLRSPSTFFSHLKAVFEIVLCYLKSNIFPLIYIVSTLFEFQLMYQ